jgi:hypothetical protein
MKYVLTTALIFLLACGGLYYWDSQTHLEPLFAQPYVAIYGRDTCAYTQRYKKDISSLHLSNVYMNIDDKSVADKLHARMKKAWVNTQEYDLPVLDINGKILIRPPMNEIQAAYRVQSQDLKFAFDLSKIKADLSDLQRKCTLKPDSKTSQKIVKPIVYKDGELKLEGISMGDPVIAMINGEMYKVNDQVGMYTLIMIDKNSVLLKDSNGEEVIKHLR